MEQIVVCCIDKLFGSDRIQVRRQHAQSCGIQAIVGNARFARLFHKFQLDGQRKHVVVYNPSVVFYLVNLAVALSNIKFEQLYKRAAKRLALPYMYVFLADDIEQFLYAMLHQIGLAQEQARQDVEFSVWLIYESRHA